MENATLPVNHNFELKSINQQIDKTISDIGRLSSYSLAPSEILRRIRMEKMGFLHLLKERKEKLLAGI